MKELELYKVFVADKVSNNINYETLKYGFVLSNEVGTSDLLKINSYYNLKKLDSRMLLKTLFSKNELENSDLIDKVIKQIRHYYSCGTYGVQDLELNGEKVSVDFIKIVSREELLELIKSDIYSNRALSQEKVLGIIELLKDYRLFHCLDFSKIKNNEFKSIAVSENIVAYANISGDDILRAIIYIATNKTLLIKSKEVIEALGFIVSDKRVIDLLKNYPETLAKCFNRHKRLFLALKNENTAKHINKIAKLSKKFHVPVKESLNKTFIFKHINLDKGDMIADIEKLSVIDKMKILYQIEVLMSDMPNRVFIIRNGKAFIKEGVDSLDKSRVVDNLRLIKGLIKKSLANNLSHLKGLKIKYPENVDYALPISEKKSVSGIPFHTEFYNLKDNYLVAGMYWENAWGAYDLDLSSISINGDRVGWGQLDSYTQDILFSGDITNASSGAIEYIANKKDKPVILINNIFSGQEGSKFKIVIGNSDKVGNKYVSDVIAELDYKFDKSKTISLGALEKDKFTLYPVSLRNNRVSGKRDKAILPFVLVKHTMMKELLELAGVKFIQDNSFDLDLSVNNVTFDKLINIFEKDCLTKYCNVV